MKNDSTDNLNPEIKSSASGMKGLAITLTVVILVFTGLALLLLPGKKETERPQFIKDAEPQVEKLENAIRQSVSLPEKKPEYDVDQTVMALFSMEKALGEARNFQELTQFVLQKEPDFVAPEVSALKYKFFNVYKKMLEAKDDIKDMDSIFNVTTGTMTDFAATLGFDFTGVNVDREQAKKVWEKRLDDARKHDKIKARLEKQQDEMLDLLFEYAKVSSKYIREWNELCSARDRAYLAFYERDWNELINCAQHVVEKAPHENEAHILLALGLIERGNETDAPAAKTIIEQLMKEHQGQQAPAYLLRGVTSLKEKKFDSATIDFDQAAAYYPKQQEEVTDILNLYKKRQFLNKSKEGRVIINTYRAVMSGSGYFSPDFQKARIFLMQGDKEKARQKIFDHFFRRRLQGQWDKVLNDFQFCRNYLDTELYEITSGEKINLELEPAWMTNSLIVTINNGSKKDIHNLTLLLCVRFTDMFKGDYISFPIGESVALLPASSKVNVGRQNISDITKESLGSIKKWKDVIEYGAVLISDEIIIWVPPAPKPETVDEPGNNSGKNTDVGDSNVIQQVIDKVVESIEDNGKK